MLFFLLSMFFLGSSATEGCAVPDPAEPFQTCNMVDYPFYMPDMETSIHVADTQAKASYQSFVDNFYNDDYGWRQTDDCANAMRSFTCALAFHRCEENNVQPLPMCQQTCNSFATTCYTDSQADHFKQSTCQYFPMDDCTRVAIPGPPAPVPIADSVIANETMDLGFPLGTVEFGLQQLVIRDSDMKVSLHGRNGTMTVAVDDATFDMSVGYWFKQQGFPWVSDSGTVKVTSTEPVHMSFNVNFNDRTRKWEGKVVSVSINLSVELFDTWLQTLKNWLISWWQGWVDDQIELALQETLMDSITPLLTFEMGLYTEQNPLAEIDVDATWHFKDGSSRRLF